MKKLPTLLSLGSILLLSVISIFSFWYSLASPAPAPAFYDLTKNNPGTSSDNSNCTACASGQNEKVILIAVGDIMLSRNVEQKMINKKDWAYPFRKTYQSTSTGDIVFANLETPLIEGQIIETGQMVFRADPKAVEGLKLGGFNVLSLANNHMKNQGTAGIDETITTLDAANIQHAGAGDNADEAQKPAIIKVDGKKFGFLAYLDSAFTPASYEATTLQSGSPFLDEQALIDDLKKLKPQVDVMIVSMHAGVEYTLAPNEKQKSFAHTAIDHGAALVIGHHPHVVEPIERYNDGYILYSLGNFVFDQMWSEETREGAMATVEFLGTQILNIKLTPTKIYEYSQPKILSDEEGKSIIERMTDFTF
jgi:poly-gamma-glutamate synthesis protein (capsule biosynthesis protein)